MNINFLQALPSGASQEKTLSLFELIISIGLGGQIIMIILFVLFSISIYIFIERYYSIKAALKTDKYFMDNVKDHVYSGKIESAKVLCKSTDTPISRMIEKGIYRIGKPLNDIMTSIENIGKLEIFKLEKNVSILATIAGSAPMIGFLGTVLGMILAFFEMSNSGGQIEVKALSKGIYTAMTTTVSGLIVGIISYMSYNFLVVKIDKIINKMEANVMDFIDLLNEPVKHD